MMKASSATITRRWRRRSARQNRARPSHGAASSWAATASSPITTLRASSLTPTWQDLRTAFDHTQNDPTVRGVILTGAGDKAFIAGADIGELAHATAIDAERSSRFGQGVLDLIENLGKPVIAAVNGFALGGGCETA